MGKSATKDNFEDLCRDLQLPVYVKATHKQFVLDCASAGLAIEHYNGRWFYEGPSVACDDIQDVIRATTVKVQWDNLGKGWIVYPK